MSCLKGPTITPPTLPAGLGITAPTITPPAFDVALCCKTPPFPPIPPIPPIPSVVLTSSLIAALNTYIAQAVTYINALEVPCPFE